MKGASGEGAGSLTTSLAEAGMGVDCCVLYNCASRAGAGASQQSTGKCGYSLVCAFDRLQHTRV